MATFEEKEILFHDENAPSLVEKNNWTRLGPIDPIDPISKTLLKPIY